MEGLGCEDEGCGNKCVQCGGMREGSSAMLSTSMPICLPNLRKTFPTWSICVSSSKSVYWVSTPPPSFTTTPSLTTTPSPGASV